MAHFKTLFYLQKASAARWGQQPCWGTPGWSVSRLQTSKVRTHKESTAGGRVAVALPHSIKHFEVAVAVICRYIITFNLFDSGTVCAFSV